jgi:hypothetical protein
VSTDKFRIFDTRSRMAFLKQDSENTLSDARKLSGTEESSVTVRYHLSSGVIRVRRKRRTLRILGKWHIFGRSNL